MLELCDDKSTICVSDDLFRTCIIHPNKISLEEQIIIYESFKKYNDIILTFYYEEENDNTIIIYIHTKEINLFKILCPGNSSILSTGVCP